MPKSNKRDRNINSDYNYRKDSGTYRPKPRPSPKPPNSKRNRNAARKSSERKKSTGSFHSSVVNTSAAPSGFLPLKVAGPNADPINIDLFLTVDKQNLGQQYGRGKMNYPRHGSHHIHGQLPPYSLEQLSYNGQDQFYQYNQHQLYQYSQDQSYQYSQDQLLHYNQNHLSYSSQEQPSHHSLETSPHQGSLSHQQNTPAVEPLLSTHQNDRKINPSPVTNLLSLPHHSDEVKSPGPHHLDEVKNPGPSHLDEVKSPGLQETQESSRFPEVSSTQCGSSESQQKSFQDDSSQMIDLDADSNLISSDNHTVSPSANKGNNDVKVKTEKENDGKLQTENENDGKVITEMENDGKKKVVKKNGVKQKIKRERKLVFADTESEESTSLSSEEPEVIILPECVVIKQEPGQTSTNGDTPKGKTIGETPKSKRKGETPKGKRKGETPKGKMKGETPKGKKKKKKKFLSSLDPDSDIETSRVVDKDLAYHVGMMAANSLRHIKKKQMVIAVRLINEVIYQGQIQNLKPNSKIVLDPTPAMNIS